MTDAKQHTLIEHIDDVKTWWLHAHGHYTGPGKDEDRILFIAYERWLNNRILLTAEDRTAP